MTPRRGATLLAVLLGSLLVYVLTSSAAPTVPVPNPVVKVHTKSGDVEKDFVVPLGGVPVPLDVDQKGLSGLLTPDVDVSVGLIAVEELPGRPIVPTIEINRNALAIARRTPAPPLKIDLTIELLDGLALLQKFATITYGYETPAGGLVPSRFKSKLVGPLLEGFVDPFEAIVETPGYSGPLQINAKVDAKTFKGDFQVGLDPLPEKLHFSADPREDGLDFNYDHQGPIPDVKLHAVADLTDPASGARRKVDALVERLPAKIRLSSTAGEGETSYEYEASSLVGKPDVEARYTNTRADGTILTDADVKVSGLPFHMRGAVRTVKNDTGGSDVNGATIDVLGGDDIDAVDFVVRNYRGAPGVVPELTLAPEQHIGVSTRRLADGTKRMWAGGRLTKVRHVGFDRLGEDREGLDITTVMGDGVKPLQAVFDLDDRGPGAPDDAKRTMVDTTLRPLARTTHARFDPAGTDTPADITYEASSKIDVATKAVIAKGIGNACGERLVTCLKAHVEQLPPTLNIQLPPDKGSDFLATHSAPAGSFPDVGATIDAMTLVEEEGKPDRDERRFTNIELSGLPPFMRGRMHQRKGVLLAAEFHACDFDFASETCRAGTQKEIRHVAFTSRDHPSRAGLPPRPDTEPQGVTLVARCALHPTDPKAPCAKERVEVHGAVDRVRNVAFRQRDIDDDGTADGTLGVLVDAGSGTEPFDVKTDTVEDALDDDDNRIGDEAGKVEVKVRPLPFRFTACVRTQAERLPDADLPDNALLETCDRTDVLRRNNGKTGDDPDDDALKSTPLSVAYSALGADGKPQRVRVIADVSKVAPDLDDLDAQNLPIDHVTKLHADVDTVPGELTVDVIPGRKPKAAVTCEPDEPDCEPSDGVSGRRLEFAYEVPDDLNDQTSERIPTVDFALESRRQGSLCEDPRANREALCVSATLKDLSRKIEGTFDPDEAKGDITLSMQRSLGEPQRPDVDPLRLSKVSADAESSPLVLTANLTDLSDELAGKVQQLNLDGENENDSSGTVAERIATCSNEDPPGTPLDDDGDGKANGKDPECGADLARASFNACPNDKPDDPDESCGGIGGLKFTATNVLLGDPLPPITPVAGVREFSFVQRGEAFRAAGEIKNLRNVGLSKLRDDGTPTPATILSAAFGGGDTLRAVVDRDTGAETQILDGTIEQAPSTVTLCFRSPADADDLDDERRSYCEKDDADGDGAADADRKAIQASVDPDAPERPDITIDRLELGKASGVQVLRGPPGVEEPGDPASCSNGTDDDGDGRSDADDSDCGPALKVDNLASEVNVLSGDDLSSTPDVDEKFVQIQGPKEGETIKQAADRVSFSLRSFDGPFTTGDGFPWGPLDQEFVDPRDYAHNAGNYLLVAKEIDQLLLEGSVPLVSRIAMRAQPCDPTDKRYPKPEVFEQASKPWPGYEFKCVEAKAGGGRPLGVAVRTLDEKNEVLAVEEGHLSQIPSGPDGLSATIAKAPKTLSDAAVCTDNAVAKDCQPPLLSIDARRGDGQGRSDVRLEGRIAMGALDVVRNAVNVVPQDVLSRALNYHKAPREFDRFGGRILVTKGVDPEDPTKTKGTALRMGLKLELPQFVDLDPLINFSCAAATLGNCLPDGDAADGVGEEENAGTKSKDIAIKLVASDDQRGGRPVDSLGRVALLVDDPTLKGGQTIITGAADPDPDKVKEIFGFPVASPETFGGTDWHPEDPTPAGEHDYGFEAPGHLDAQVFLRTDYRAATDGVQNEFVQIDGRFNKKVTLAVRLQEAERPGRHTGSNSLLREGELIPKTSFTVRNAPGLGVNAPDLNDPTLRVRAEIRKGKYEPPGDPRGIKCGGLDDIPKIGEAIAALVNVELCFLANIKTAWTDVAVNAQPDPDLAPARAIEAVVDRTDGNNLELRAFEEVDAPDVPFDERDPAKFTPQANLMLAPFELGVGAGVDVLGGLVGGRVLAGLGGRHSHNLVRMLGGKDSLLRLSNNKNAVQLASSDGPGFLSADWNAFPFVNIRLELFWHSVMFDVPIDAPGVTLPIPLAMRKCPNIIEGGSGTFRVDANGNEKTGITIGPAGSGALSALAAAIHSYWDGGYLLAQSAISGLGCFAFETTDSELINAEHPAPSFNHPGRPVPGTDDQPETSVPPVTPPAEVTRPDLHVPAGTSMTLCGTIVVGHLVVDGEILVGEEGATNTQTIGGVTQEVTCDGGLTIDALKVDVRGNGVTDPNTGITNGLIEASGTRTTRGEGHPLGPGAGAGHGGDGGRSGLNGLEGHSYTVDPPRQDFGSTGGAGTTPDIGGGDGGGVIEINSEDYILINGKARVSANGARGGDAIGAGCDDVGGGGGSGGALQLRANLVRIGANTTVEARGGHGGEGANGGGGGGGGRITIDTVDREGSVSTRHGNAGAAESGCTAGQPGHDGPGVAGEHFFRVARVNPVQDSPYFKQKIKLQVEALQEDGGPFVAVVCRRPGGSLQDPALDPPEGADLAALVDPPTESGVKCQSVYFPFRNFDREGSGEDDTYIKEIEVDPEADGFYGFYALGAKPANINGNQITSCHGDAKQFCAFQPILPNASGVKAVRDVTQPTVVLSEALPKNCPDLTGAADQTTCARQIKTTASIAVDDETSGVEPDSVQCQIHFGGIPIRKFECGSGEQEIQFKSINAFYALKVILKDRSGNVLDGNSDPKTPVLATWLFDDRPPSRPDITVTPDNDSETNGWLHKEPAVTAKATDPNRGGAGGLKPVKPITLAINGKDNGCGAVTVEGLESVGRCDSLSTAPFVPSRDGTYVVDGHATDHVGNQSAPFLPEEREKFRIDGNPPTSDVFLGPTTPDGDNGLYVRPPFVGFGTSDPPGGSGVDPDESGSGVFYAIDKDASGWKPGSVADGGDFSLYDPDGDLRLTEGTHDVCWYAVDVAGNAELGKDPFHQAPQDNCKFDVRTDSTAPAVSLAVSPAMPDGGGGFYVTKPVVTPSGTDAEGVEPSGMDRVQYQLDEGPWKAAETFAIPEGFHEVRVRGFDKAGNAAPIIEHTFAVDLSAPSTKMINFPPAPNAQGWFRQPRVHSLAVEDAPDGSGIAGATYAVDGGSAVGYTGPFSVGHGANRTASGQSFDIAGHASNTDSAASAVDLLAPVAKVVEPAPAAIIVPGDTTTLRWAADGTLTPQVRVFVQVYNVLGRMVGRIPAGSGYRPSGSGSVTWDGKDQTGRGVLAGLYHYRVVTVDQAGNTAISSESASFAVMLATFGIPGMPLP